VEHKRTLNFYFRISIARSRFSLLIVWIVILHWENAFILNPPSEWGFQFYWSFPGRLAIGDRPVTLINVHRFIKYALAVWKIMFYAPPAAICPRQSPQSFVPVCVCICVSGKSCNLMRQFRAGRWSIDEIHKTQWKVPVRSEKCHRNFQF